MTTEARYDDISRRLAGGEIDHLTAAQMRGERLLGGSAAGGAGDVQPSAAAPRAGRHAAASGAGEPAGASVAAETAGASGAGEPARASVASKHAAASGAGEPAGASGAGEPAGASGAGEPAGASVPGKPAVRPHYSVRRVACGAWWALGTLLLAIATIANLASGSFLQALVALALTGLVGWYDYRVWTFKAKWLMFLIIF